MVRARRLLRAEHRLRGRALRALPAGPRGSRSRRRGRCSPAPRRRQLPSSPRSTDALRPSPQISSAAAAASLAQAIRLFGHRAAQLDPLGSEPPGDPQLDYRRARADRGRSGAAAGGASSAAGRSAGASNAAVAIHRLEHIYCGTSGYEFAHVGDPAERAWLLEAVEEERFRPPNDPVDERGLLDRLTEVSAFERFLHRAYPGQTRFSVEGLGHADPDAGRADRRRGRARHALDRARAWPIAAG